jgi:hypothetical protein
MSGLKKRRIGLDAGKAHGGGAQPDACPCGHENLPLFPSVTTDPLEVLSIVLMRHFMAGHCWPELGYLDSGLDCAETMLGPLDGPSVYARNLALVRAIECERRGDFLFMAPGCDRISEDEQEVAAALRASRGRATRQAEAAIARLTRRRDAPRTLMAIQALAAMLDRLALIRSIGAGAPRPAPAGATLH